MSDILRIAVVGGAGHVGLPLSLMLAANGFSVTVIDTHEDKIAGLQRGEFPFLEEGGAELLKNFVGSALTFGTKHKLVAECDAIILTVGTPVDEHLNPRVSEVFASIDQLAPYLRDGQVLILRSTLFPGTSDKIREYLAASGFDIGVSFCPERIAQGHAIRELRDFPQIISGSDERALNASRQIFSTFASEVIELPMAEAELAKLFTNAWRYIKFAVANQFYLIAEEKGYDFYRIRHAMVHNYRRASDFPVAGFAAGPCLFKDTMQLAAFNRQNFALGHAAMLLNETLPDFLVEQVKRNRSLAGATVGILGMAYKADNDDSRDSLAYKLLKLLTYEHAVVMCTDPYVDDPRFFSVEQVLEKCDLIFIGCPHSAYKLIDFGDREVVDCWGLTREEKVSD